MFFKNVILASISLISLIACNDSSSEIDPQIEKPLEDTNATVSLSDTLLLDTVKTADISDENYWFDDNYDGLSFIEAGISQPTAFIENALRNQPNLIPLEAVLGGTMHFGKIDLLSEKWLIAEFDDGHVYGRAIYSFKIDKENKVKFKLLDWIGPID